MPPPQVFGARSGITEEAAQVEEQGNQSNDGCDEATASIFPPKPLIANAHLHTIAPWGDDLQYWLSTIPTF